MDKRFKKNLAEMITFMQKGGLQLDPLPKVIFKHGDNQIGDPMLHNTGHYEPVQKVITIYTHGRHPKDIMKTIAHEMYHHHQNLNGEMTPEKMGESSDPKYAQNNNHLRRLEEDAYKCGNMWIRDWTDNKKYKN
jgi:hypothetical protein